MLKSNNFFCSEITFVNSSAVRSLLCIASYKNIPRIELSKKEEDVANSLEFEREMEFRSSRALSKISVQLWDKSNKNNLEAYEVLSGVFKNPILYRNGIVYNNISISHSSNRCACLIYDEKNVMGVDLIEREDSIILNAKFATQNEINIAGKCNELSQVIWSAKESLSKALKCGLSINYKTLETKKIIKNTNSYEGYFTNISHLKFYSFVKSHFIVTIVCSSICKLNLNRISLDKN